MHFKNFILEKVKKTTGEENIKFSWSDDYLTSGSYCLYQVEQLEVPGKLSNKYIDMLTKAKKIYEYSKLNLDLYPKNIIQKVEFFPLLPELNSKYHDKDTNIDILFYGIVSQRRKIVLENFEKQNLKLYIDSNLSLNEMKEKICQSKFVLSCGTYSNKYNDSFRVSVALDLGANILYEITGEDWYNDYIFNNFPNRIHTFKIS